MNGGAVAYSLHIERVGADSEPVPIPVAEWREAVAQTPGVRPFAAEALAPPDPQVRRPVRPARQLAGIAASSGRGPVAFVRVHAQLRRISPFPQLVL